MTISTIMGISLAGMQAQQTGVQAAANNVANALTPTYDRLDRDFSTTEPGGVTASVRPSGQPTFDDAANVDLTSEMLSLVEGETSFRAAVAAWETGADIWDVLLSIKRD